MKGRRLKLIPADIVAFGVWKLDHPQGRVLAPNPEIEARGDEYAPSDWERNMARRRVVTTLPKGSPFQARTLIVGITVNGHAKAYALNDLRASRVLLDVVDERPVLIVATDDGRSVRVFDRRVDGRVVEFAASPTSVSITPDAAGPAGRTTAAPRAPLLIDLDTASEWDFAGRAISGPDAGKTLTRLPICSRTGSTGRPIGRRRTRTSRGGRRRRKSTGSRFRNQPLNRVEEVEGSAESKGQVEGLKGHSAEGQVHGSGGRRGEALCDPC